MDTLRVFCWCGKSQGPVPVDAVWRAETWECDAACRTRYETRGVDFDGSGRSASAAWTGNHPVNCRCSPECRENRRAYRRAYTARKSA